MEDSISVKKAELARIEAQAMALKAEIAQERNKQLSQLHLQFDCKSTAELMDLLRALSPAKRVKQSMSEAEKVRLRADLKSGMTTELAVEKYKTTPAVVHGMRRVVVA